MDKIKKLNNYVVIYNGTKLYFRNKGFSPDVDKRGRREKFWLGDGLLLKLALNKDSLESHAEVVICTLSKHVNVNCAEYRHIYYAFDNKHSCAEIDEKFDEIVENKIINNEIESAVMAINYKAYFSNAKDIKDIKEIEEISGKSLLQNYSNNVYDNKHGKEIALHNTVQNYVKAAKELFPNANHEKIETDLMKMALLDYCVHQTDRHFYNVSLLKHKDHIEVAKVYDNGAALLLNYGKDKLNRIYNEICKSEQAAKKEGIKEPLDFSKPKVPKSLNNFLKHLTLETPMLGIKTSTSSVYIPPVEEGGVSRVMNIPIKDEQATQMFLNELVTEIINNKELYKTLVKFSKVKMDEVINEAEQTSYFKMDDSEKKLASIIFNYKTQNLLKLVKQRIAENENTK